MIGVSPLSGFGVGPGKGIRFEGSGCLPWYALFLKRHITVSVAYAYREPLRNSSRMATPQNPGRPTRLLNLEHDGEVRSRAVLGTQ